MEMLQLIKRAGLIALTFAVWGCSNADDSDFAMEDLQPDGPYFLDAELFGFANNNTQPLQYFVDLDSLTPGGQNQALISELQPGLTELYSVFNSDTPQLDNSAATQERIQQLSASFGGNYGTVSYLGLGFGFFVEGLQSEAASMQFQQLLEAGQELEFGSAPGQVEIGYYKNAVGAESTEDRGLVSLAESNSDGFFRVVRAQQVITPDNQPGYQLRIEFACTLYQQLGGAAAARVEGQAAIFLPQP